MAVCKEEGCEETKLVGQGFCRSHYNRRYRAGELVGTTPPAKSDRPVGRPSGPSPGTALDEGWKNREPVSDHQIVELRNKIVYELLTRFHELGQQERTTLLRIIPWKVEGSNVSEAELRELRKKMWGGGEAV